MHKAIELQKGYVHCDACDTNLESIDPDNIDDLKKWIDAPCPNCGASEVINQKDFDTLKATFLLVEVVNNLCPVSKEDSFQKVTVKIGDNNIETKERK